MSIVSNLMTHSTQTIGCNFLKIDEIETSHSYLPLVSFMSIAFKVLKLERGSKRPPSSPPILKI